ncbi:MAG: hypothetical protein P4L64_00770, partial [Caulobacteraceae bacterium]|nr:hypothetical protein [Caulobacteraceae bacterium]
MRRLFIALSLVGILSAGASQAQEKPKAEVGEQAVLLSPVALPIVIDGHLVNYVFVTAKIWL